MIEKRIKHRAIYTLILLLLSIGTVLGNDRLSNAQIKAIFSGATAKGEIITTKSGAIGEDLRIQTEFVFFDGGKLKKSVVTKKSGSRVQEGKWWLHKKKGGWICFRFDNEKKNNCREVRPASSGGYDLYNNKGRLVIQFTSVSGGT